MWVNCQSNKKAEGFPLNFGSSVEQLDSLSLRPEVRSKYILLLPHLRPFLSGCRFIDLQMLLVWRPLKDRQTKRNRYTLPNLELDIVLHTALKDQSNKKLVREMSCSVLSTGWRGRDLPKCYDVGDVQGCTFRNTYTIPDVLLERGSPRFIASRQASGAVAPWRRLPSPASKSVPIHDSWCFLCFIWSYKLICFTNWIFLG